MKGWINTIEVWHDANEWDALFNADTETRAQFDAWVLTQMDSGDAQHSFMIPSKNGKYRAETLKSSDTIIFNWDST